MLANSTYNDRKREQNHNKHHNQNQNHHSHHQNKNDNNRQQQQQQHNNQRNKRNNNNSISSNAASTKIQHPSISKISDYPKSVIYGSLDSTIPGHLPKELHSSSADPSSSSQPVVNDLPKFASRPTALLVNTILGSTFLETLSGVKDPQRSSTDLNDPACQIVMKNRSRAKTLKLGDIEIEIHNLNQVKPKKLINKLLVKDSFASTPLKRNRDEVIEVSSSMKKNKRTLELQHQETSMMDTTMELSFEGKAMDRSDIVKLVDDSVILPDESHYNERNQYNSNNIFDTKNLLQNTDFTFDFR